jgi:hypothetical protein
MHRTVAIRVPSHGYRIDIKPRDRVRSPGDAVARATARIASLRPMQLRGLLHGFVLVVTVTATASYVLW